MLLSVGFSPCNSVIWLKSSSLRMAVVLLALGYKAARFLNNMFSIPIKAHRNHSNTCQITNATWSKRTVGDRFSSFDWLITDNRSKMSLFMISKTGLAFIHPRTDQWVTCNVVQSDYKRLQVTLVTILLNSSYPTQSLLNGQISVLFLKTRSQPQFHLTAGNMIATYVLH